MGKCCANCKHENEPVNKGICMECTEIGRESEYYSMYAKWEPKEKEETEMSVETKIYTHEKMVDVLKKCGQSIIENAESIVGHEPYVREIRVTVRLDPSRAATINVDRDFYPEGIIK